MQKLRDAKKIKWTESYTEKSSFLRDQFNAVVGKGSYKRCEGKEIGGPGEWYAVVSPADVHEHKRAKFFAGVRKLPDSYPAGGKYFDTIKEAYEYAFDTWGVPKPQNIPSYTSGDLKGISKRIEKWKSEQEKKEMEGKIIASIPFDIFRIRRAMGREAVYKDDLVFDFKIFIPFLEEINLSAPNACDILYDRLLVVSGYSSPEDVIKELDENKRKYSDYAKTTLPSGDEAPWKEENLGFARDINDFSKDPRNTRDPDELKSMYRLAVKVMTIGRKKRKDIFESIYKEPGTFENVNMENIDRRALRSNFEEAILSTYSKYISNVQNIGRCYDFTVYMYERYRSQFDNKKRESLKDLIISERGGEKPVVPESETLKPRENIEGRILTLDEFRAKLASTDPKDKEFVNKWTLSADKYPLKSFVTYSRRDSACRYWVSAPYNSDRSFYRRYSIVAQSFDKDANGFDQVDYALLFTNGKRMESFVPKMGADKVTPLEGELERIGKLVYESRAFIISLGKIPDQIRSYLKGAEVTAPGNRTVSAISLNLEPKQFNVLLEEISRISGGKIKESNLNDGFRNVFRGWGKYIKGQYIVERDLNQRVEAKRFGAYYFGKKDVHDKVSSGEILQLFQEQSDGIFSDKSVPVSEVVRVLVNFQGYKGLNEEKQKSIKLLIDSLMDFGKKSSTIDFDSFNIFVQNLELRDVFGKDDVLYLFSEALKIGGQVPTSRSVKGKREDFHTTIRRGIDQKANKIEELNIREDLLNPLQKAILKYRNSKGWERIKNLLGWKRQEYGRQRKDEEYISTIKLTRILRDQTEDVEIVSKDDNGDELREVKTVRIFSDKEIKDLIDTQKSKVAKTSFDDYRTLVDRGDVVLNTFINGDRISVSRLTLSDYAYWKILKNKFRNKWDLLEKNPELYENILRNFFTPIELREVIGSINAPIFFSKVEKNPDGTPKQVSEDEKGNKLFFINNEIKIKVVDPKGRSNFIAPENSDNYSVTFSSQSPEENIKKIEEELEKYFSDPKNRSGYKITDSFVGYLPENTRRSALSIRNYGKSKDFVTRIRQLKTVQQKVMLEMFKDMAKGTMLPPGVSSPDELTPGYNAMLQSLAVSLEGTKRNRPGEDGKEYSSKDFNDKFKKAKSVIEKFLIREGGKSPYSVENYWEAYETQISPSTVVNLTSSLGFYVWREVAGDVESGKGGKKRVSSEIDFTRNPKNAALVTNIPYAVFNDRASQAVNAPKNVAYTDEDLQDPNSEVTGYINSKDLAVAFAVRFNRAATQDELSKFEIAFESASISRGKLVSLLRNAAIKRMETSIIYDYDPLISKSVGGEDAMVWYRAWRDPEFGQAAFIITANYLLSWIHEGSVNKENLPKILGLGGFEDDEMGGAGTVEEIINKALFSSKVLGDVQKEIPIDPKEVEEEEKNVDQVVEQKATEGTQTDTDKNDDEENEEKKLEEQDKSVPVTRTNETPTIEEPVAEEVPEEDSIVEEQPVRTERRVPVQTEETGFLEDPEDPEDPEDFESEQEPAKIVSRPPPRRTPSPAVSYEEEDESMGEESEEEKRKRKLRDLGIFVEQTPGKGSSGKNSKSLLNLMRVAKVFSDKNQDDKAEAIIQFVKDHFEKDSSNESSKRIAVIQALSNLVYVSKTLLKRGKTEEAKEINKIIKKHIDTITSSEQGI